MDKTNIPPQVSLQQLQQFIELSRLIQGDIKEITVTKEFIEDYDKQIKQVAKNLNIPTTKNYKEHKFLGVKLTTK